MREVKRVQRERGVGGGLENKQGHISEGKKGPTLKIIIAGGDLNCQLEAEIPEVAGTCCFQRHSVNQQGRRAEIQEFSRS